MQESIEHCLADAQAEAALREEKTEARWSASMTNSSVKLDLLRTNVDLLRMNVAAKKRNTDMAFLMGGADMLQSNDEQLRAWYMAERGLILNQMQTATPTTPTTLAPAPMATRMPSPNDASTSPPSSTEAAPTQPSTEAATTPPSPRTPTPPTPGADPAE